MKISENKAVDTALQRTGGAEAARKPAVMTKICGNVTAAMPRRSSFYIAREPSWSWHATISVFTPWFITALLSVATE
jgi:hypothetical protein